MTQITRFCNFAVAVFGFKSPIFFHNPRVSDRSGNPATQHVLNAETGIYEKIDMLRCRLERRARPGAKRRGTPLTPNPSKRKRK
ncbi:hypothetical protein FHG68_14960 [Leptospira weilii]|nr:hypothetical protein FHG67_07290 [Leptospira weilii]QDK27824.1 hypothetical protein FHG68_14960 [Leptospira weilii]